MTYFQNKNRNLPQKRLFNLNNFNSQLAIDVVYKQNQKINSIKCLKEYQKRQSQKLDLLQITGKEVVNYNNGKVCNRSTSQKSPKYNKQIKQLKLMLQASPQKMRTLLDYNLQKKQKDAQLYSTNINYNNQTRSHFNSKINNFTQENLIQEKEKNDNYYQKIILQDPLLYNQVIKAYKSLKRQTVINSQKQQRATKKRQSIVDNKISNKNKEFDTKNDHQKKRIVSFGIYRQMLLLINFSNKQCLLPQQEALYRAFIGKGNNGLLIKSILKSRPWWCIRTSSDVQTCNLIWTQWKNPKLMKLLPNKQSQFSIIKSSQQNLPNLQTIKIETIKKIIPTYTRNQVKKILQPQENISGYTKFNKKMCDQKSLQIIPKILPLENNYKILSASKNFKLINHIPGCFQLHSKKLLFSNMKKYYQKKNKNVFDYLPQTFLITRGINDPQFQTFKQIWIQNQKSKDKKNKNIWICKPGQNSNRGNGIAVAKTLQQIKTFVCSQSSTNGGRTTIIQKYMQNPFLYNKRKFDIRCYILITTVNGIVKGYWYQQGYIRTTSKQFNLKNLDNKFVHLTNDAIQKKGEDYGRFENFNKVSYQQFQKYIQTNFTEEKFDFKQTLSKMKQIATDLINSVGLKLNPQKKQYAFEIFGLDFMLDDKLTPVILQANSNPCIQVDGPVLGKIIPTFLQNMIRIVIDPIFPPPLSQNPKNSKFSAGNTFQQNKFSLVYDSLFQQKKKEELVNKEQLQEQALFNQEIQGEINQF